MSSEEPFDSYKTNISIEDIQAEVEKLSKQCNEYNENKELFTTMPANKWMEQAKARPIPRMLFSELWHEGELCILFADTNLGKSILAVQIANSISKGQAIKGFKLECPKQAILYFDFELSEKQFENRYSIDFNNAYQFDNNFNRVEINTDAVMPDNYTFELFLNESLDKLINTTNIKILIIDNLTYLKNDTERAKDALSLMKFLKALKSKYGLSILALAHIPKRDFSKPINSNDLQGSKMLINFCDSAFTIGLSYTDKNLRYLKQIKARNTEIIFDKDNVCVCEIEKPSNFLAFNFLNFGSENQHLKQHTENDKSEIIEKVKLLISKNKTQRDISTELGISLGLVNKY